MQRQLRRTDFESVPKCARAFDKEVFLESGGAQVKGVKSVVLVMLLLLLGWFVWPTPYIYQSWVGGLLVRIHRLSGGVDVLRGDGWQAMEPVPVVSTAAPTPAASDSPDCLGTPVPGEPGEFTIDPRCLDKAPEKPASQR